MTENDISYEVIGAIYNVYNSLGPGLLENVYEKVLLYELKKRGLKAESQISIPIIYDGQSFGNDLRADIIVENKVIIELKSVSEMQNVFFKQLLTYLRLSNKKLGILVNFNTDNIRQNIHRVVNHL
ncbi:GxxExxY protein [Prevotella sp. HUN102]|uniref:GxxExxY protein n=1 Tax=Prevotella sp. HUN102 TaxID=1392486 RepID=UPI00048F67E0|nr:GxxExxY protein [Prevotella sp. HUN102]